MQHCIVNYLRGILRELGEEVLLCDKRRRPLAYISPKGTLFTYPKTCESKYAIFRLKEKYLKHKLLIVEAMGVAHASKGWELR